MRALTLVFAIGLAVATTADGALAQNTLLLGRGQPPRQTTVPLTTYPNYGDKFWEKMTLDEKCDQLRERIEMLVVEIANDQRKLHDRLVKLEQAHEARAQ